MKNTKQILVTNINWDAPKYASLPKEVTIDINKENTYLLEDINDDLNNLCEYLSNEYEYCVNELMIELK